MLITLDCLGKCSVQETEGGEGRRGGGGRRKSETKEAVKGRSRDGADFSSSPKEGG